MCKCLEDRKICCMTWGVVLWDTLECTLYAWGCGNALALNTFEYSLPSTWCVGWCTMLNVAATAAADSVRVVLRERKEHSEARVIWPHIPVATRALQAIFFPWFLSYLSYLRYKKRLTKDPKIVIRLDLDNWWEKVHDMLSLWFLILLYFTFRFFIFFYSCEFKWAELRAIISSVRNRYPCLVEKQMRVAVVSPVTGKRFIKN